MRILVDARALGTKPSGIGMYIYRFAKALAQQENLELILASDVMESNEMKKLSELSSVSVRLYGDVIKKGFAVWSYARFLKKTLDETKPDIFWEMNELLPMRFSNPYGKFIITLHDVFPVTMPEYYSRLYRYYFKRGLKITLNSCDGVLFISETARSEATALFPIINRLKTQVGYIIVDPIPENDGPRSDYFFYVGNLENRKGTDILLTAYRRYLERGGSRDLYLAGKIRDSNIQVLLDAMLSYSSKVHYLGYVDSKERNKLLQDCCCLVFPSRAEGFGIPVIEALSCGTPVLASDLDIFKELVGDKIDYFSLADSFEDSCNNLEKSMIDFDGKKYKPHELSMAASRFNESSILHGVIEYLHSLMES